MSDAAATRASDADRERLAEALREHYAAGRLSAEQLGEPAPELDRVQRELERRSSRRRRPHHRTLP